MIASAAGRLSTVLRNGLSAPTKNSTINKLAAQSPAVVTSVRQLRLNRQRWYKGIYKTDGDQVAPDDLLVCQYDWNYHPGLNASVH